MEKARKTAIKIISFSTLTLVALAVMDAYLFIPVVSSYQTFYEEKDHSLDMVLIGNSTLREGYIPILSYHEYGIANYSISASPTHLEVIKIAMEEVAIHQSPKMVFVDLSGLTFQSHDNQQMYVKEFVSAMPESERKEELYHTYPYLRRDEKDFLFPYHNTFRQQIYWEALVYKKAFHTKGYFPNDIVANVTPASVDYTSTLPLTEDANLYLDEILEVASRHPNIDLVFGRMARVYTHDTEKDAFTLRSCKAKIEEKGFTYVDFSEDWENIGLDPSRDQKDVNHLNHRGAVKFTRYLGKYFCSRYGVDAEHPLTHDEDVKESFDRSYEEYCETVKDIEKKLGM